ncbi:MAG: carboxypeptidase regulatory-like domain-containing protein [Pseudomonadota bacterium]
MRTPLLFMALLCHGVTALAGTLTGTVTRTADGTPVEGLQIVVFDAGSVEVARINTDGSGVYAANDLTEGGYFVRTANAGDFDLINELHRDIPCPEDCVIPSGERVNVPDGGATIVDFSLEKGASISGRLTRADTGDPIVDTFVGVQQFVGDELIPFGQGFVDEDGNYRVGGLLPGDNYILVSPMLANVVFVPQLFDGVQCPCRLSDGDRISLADGEDRTGVDFVHEVSNLSISGRITANGEPIENLLVTAELLGLPQGGVETINGQGQPTDADGNYTLLGLVPGDYTVRTVNAGEFGLGDEFYDNFPGTADREDVTVVSIDEANNAATGIDFELESGGSISGRVTRSDTGAGVSSLVIARDESGTEFAGVESAPGVYRISGLPPGTYTARTFSANQQSDLIPELFDDIQCANEQCGGQAGTPIIVGENQDVVGIDFALDPGATIRGTIVSEETGDPLPGLVATVFDSTGVSVNLAFVDIAGNFAVRGLVPGDYRLVVERAGAFGKLNEAFDDVLCVGICDPLQGDLITVTGSEIVDVLFELGDYPRFTADAPEELDRLGAALAVDGDQLVIGIPGDDEAGEDAGAALVFQRTGGAFGEPVKIFAENPLPGERFGASVDLEDGILVVGAPGIAVVPKGASAPDKTAAVFRLTGQSPEPLATLIASNLANPAESGFGASVSIDGSLIVIGAPGGQKEDSDLAGEPSGQASGAAVVFVPDAQATSWSAQAVLADPEGQAGDEFGSAVSVSNGRAAVGAPAQLSPEALGTGLVQVFENLGTGAAIGNIGKFGPDDPANADEFGAAVAFEGERLIIGAPGAMSDDVETGAAYLFSFDGDAFSQLAQFAPFDPLQNDLGGDPLLLGRDEGRFGASVALADDVVLVGALMEDSTVSQSGAAYVFAPTPASAVPVLTDRIVSTTPASGDALGTAVAFDGATLAVGVPGADADGAVAGGAVLNVTAAELGEVVFSDGFEPQR